MRMTAGMRRERKLSTQLDQPDIATMRHVDDV